MSGTFNKVHLIRQVDLFTLKLFLTVIEEGQVGRAAARENIAASAATKRIQDLEAIVGAELFDRNPRGVIPSAAGLVLARHLTKVFNAFEDVRRNLGELSEGVRGMIRVASTGGIISRYVAHDVAEFARDFPLVDIDLQEHMNGSVLRAVAAGEVDVGVFVSTPGLPEDEIDTIEYRQDRLIALVPAGHPLADRPYVKMRELFEHTYIALSPRTSLMAHVRQAAADARLDFKPKYTVNSVYAATGLVRMQQGVTIQPEHMLMPRDMELVRTVPLDEPWALRRLVVAKPRERGLSMAMRNFITQLTRQPV
ncbi:LysR family transcriptional regulator [Pseudorhodoferax sp.]|uniref:LysR family transcriptional regulator n=1 Tax=Pseudorhodoferax sp. TaxID=1993553 RepID=UPI0039E2B3FA